ncbi:PD-(D/E)XK nuclease family protein [Burkholderia reimsis]|uniref:PD-(D/E)XK nuclease family protein n=2 Tax=Burkholderia reimsis TaxID=2234132 RepID=A0A365QWL8_9BURK|nr:PD-(D/E)XK nuclease family protein [Burkholderia reimsis]RBB38879.1 PD-(D/E)XK nuclease family protein [Burkholderia reimsis]
MTIVSRTKVRASSWGALFDCAYKWEYEVLNQHRKAVGLRAALGTAIHASTAVFDQALIDGNTIKPADAAEVFVNKLKHPEYDVDYTQDELTVKQAESIGLTLHTKYCTTIAPTMRYESVEAPFMPLDIDCGGGVIVQLTGTMDRARVASGKGRRIVDLKSGERAIVGGTVTTRGHAAQCGTYQLLDDHTTGKTSEGAQIVGLMTSSKPRVGVSPVFDARKVMVGTDGQKGLIEYAAEMFRTGLFPPNPRSMLCSPKYCARWNSCIFHE